MSNSFSNANNKSPLISLKSPQLSESSPSPSPSNSKAPAFFGSALHDKEGDSFFKMTPVAQVEEESKTVAGQSSRPKETTVLRGTLRKKGLIFMNERDVTLNTNGVLQYYHFDKPGVVKGRIDLTSINVQSVRFTYVLVSREAAKKNPNPQKRPAPDMDDEFRITM